MLVIIDDVKIEIKTDTHMSGDSCMFLDPIKVLTESKEEVHSSPKLRLIDQVCEVLYYHHYVYRTEQTYS